MRFLDFSQGCLPHCHSMGFDVDAQHRLGGKSGHQGQHPVPHPMSSTVCPSKGPANMDAVINGWWRGVPCRNSSVGPPTSIPSVQAHGTAPEWCTSMPRLRRGLPLSGSPFPLGVPIFLLDHGLVAGHIGERPDFVQQLHGQHSSTLPSSPWTTTPVPEGSNMSNPHSPNTPPPPPWLAIPARASTPNGGSAWVRSSFHPGCPAKTP